MDIRIADRDDIKSLAGLVSRFRDYLERNTPTDGAFLAGIGRLMEGEDAEFVIASEGGWAAGYVLLRYRFSMWADGTEAAVEDLFVDPQHRRGGCGGRLIEYAVDRARERGCTSVCLDTNENNVASNRIYCRMGFQSASKRWGNGKQIFYRKSLAEG